MGSRCDFPTMQESQSLDDSVQYRKVRSHAPVPENLGVVPLFSNLHLLFKKDVIIVVIRLLIQSYLCM